MAPAASSFLLFLLLPLPLPLILKQHPQPQLLRTTKTLFPQGDFLSNEELEKLKFLKDFVYFKELKSGSLWVRVMGAEEMEMTIGLLAKSFAESMVLPAGYVSVLKFLVKQYLMERKVQMPHMATLICFYKEIGEGGEEQELQLAWTVEFVLTRGVPMFLLQHQRLRKIRLIYVKWP